MSSSAPSDAGYDFSRSLADAIEQVTSAADDFRYGDVDLRRAVQCELYVQLVNHSQLYRSFRRVWEGRPPASVRLDTTLQCQAASLLLGNEAAARLSPRAVLRRSAASRFWRLTRPQGPVAMRGEHGTAPIAFTLDHPKFLRFLAPVFNILDQRNTVVISAVPEVGEALVREPRPWVGAYGAASMPRPNWSAMAPCLRERPHLAARFDQQVAILNRVRPRSVVVIEGNSPVDEIARTAAERVGIPSVCIQQGWSPITHTGFRNMSFDRMLVWGEGFRALLGPHNPNQTFTVTGSPVFSAQPLVATEKALLTQIGDRTAIGMFLPGTSRLNSAEDVQETLALARRLALRLPEAVIVLRDHPQDPAPKSAMQELSELDNVVVAPPDSISLIQMLRAVSVAVSIYSTTLLEAAALGRPAVSFNPTSLPRYVPDLEALGAGVELSDSSTAEEAIVRLVRDASYRASFLPGLERVRKHFFAGAQANAAEQIVSAIDQLAVSPPVRI